MRQKRNPKTASKERHKRREEGISLQVRRENRLKIIKEDRDRNKTDNKTAERER